MSSSGFLLVLSGSLQWWMGSTVMLNTVGGAGGAVGYRSKGAVVLLRQILQEQNRMKRQTRVAPIIAPGEVKIQWLNGTSLASSLASLVMVSSSWSKTSTLNLPEILVCSLAMAVVTTSFSDCWKSCPSVQVQSSHFEWMVISLLSSAIMMWSIVLM